MEATKQTVENFGPIMHTIYGGMWQLSNSSGYEKYQDTAYTTQELSVHTDNTYFFEPAGYWIMQNGNRVPSHHIISELNLYSDYRLQIFHCLKPADQGGETVLVDGFKAASILKEEYPTHYECLKSTPIEWQYISNDHHYTCVRPIINIFPNSEKIEQMRSVLDLFPAIHTFI